jgi:hypothetical protein
MALKGHIVVLVRGARKRKVERAQQIFEPLGWLEQNV